MSALFMTELLMAGQLTGCSRKGVEVPCAERTFFAMDTIMQLTCYGENCEEAAGAAVEEIERLDALLSVGNADSEVSRINEKGGGSLSEDTKALVTESLKLYERTEGAFDITILPVMELWGFTTGDYHVPKEDELASVMELVGSGRLSYDVHNNMLKLTRGQGIDFGGIAKGYASDRLAAVFGEYGLEAAYASLGGNIYCYHNKPDGSGWRIGIQDPNNPNHRDRLLGGITVSDEAVITSGGYERYFEDESGQVRYHHIIDPQTGYPAGNGLISVTVVSSCGMQGDGLSTACYIMGLDKSIAYWQKYGDEEGSRFGLILMAEDGTVYVTEDIAGRFTSQYKTVVVVKE